MQKLLRVGGDKILCFKETLTHRILRNAGDVLFRCDLSDCNAELFKGFGVHIGKPFSRMVAAERGGGYAGCRSHILRLTAKQRYVFVQLFIKPHRNPPLFDALYLLYRETPKK